MLNSHALEETMFKSRAIRVEALSKFYKKYLLYKIYDDYRNFLNKVILLIWEIKKITWRNKIISALITIIGLLALDYSMAWKNLNYIINLIKKIL